ncbi:SRPBCC family protein [Streptomyces wuyuanensis]|uniref:Polyketide cyclase / dehydrase and lipid transport n=1 Tax=Streptomyces wuyuanensis TaxID=1196353 RepID=A0A1G9TUY3_9ACTN|nr:hypothetical protein [Streptomyces wuyuanensis]SDM51483.1 hypothetical protein SAMN05444921_109127 [Streptomyces wuyuanensis]
MADVRDAGGMLSAVDPDAVERVKAELRNYAVARAEYLLASLGRRLGEAVVTLHDIADGRSPGFARLALDGGRKLSQGKSPVRAAVEIGASRLKDNISDRVARRLTRAGGDHGPAVVVESVDVGVPVARAYELWARQEALPALAMGVREETASDENGVVWTSRGAKGTVDGVVTFHAIGETLTRVLLVVEYHPRGLVERAGALLGTPGRRARLDLTGFARRVAMRRRDDDDRPDADHDDASAPEGQESHDHASHDHASHDHASHDDETDDDETDDDETDDPDSYDPDTNDPDSYDRDRYDDEAHADGTYSHDTARAEAGTGGTP